MKQARERFLAKQSILMFYDVPQVVVAHNDNTRLLLMYMEPEIREAMGLYSYMGVAITEATERSLVDGDIDLRTVLIENQSAGVYLSNYVKDLGYLNKKSTHLTAFPEEHLPDTGLFFNGYWDL